MSVRERDEFVDVGSASSASTCVTRLSIPAARNAIQCSHRYLLLVAATRLRSLPTRRRRCRRASPTHQKDSTTHPTATHNRAWPKLHITLLLEQEAREREDKEEEQLTVERPCANGRLQRCEIHCLCVVGVVKKKNFQSV